MKEAEKQHSSKKTGRLLQKYNIREFVERVKKLEGDPHYIAMGMAIGVFVGITPTMPFHTVIAVALAFILRGSKAAAAIGVWFCNPISAPFFYLGSYKTGMFIFGNSAPFDVKYESVLELLELGMDVTMAMVVGGIILGIFPGFASYFITRKIITTIQSRKTAGL
ncbi:MAG: DUF2062 domain-containing protein [Thermodesulfobacteriota bacterium]|nr:DUF2062 domain-containing protein [Thermodesulfobacteriota bacterium]